MKNLLAVLLLAPAILLAQDNPNYDPDYNGDGCFSITDVLGLLPLFGSCVEADTPWACGDSVFFDSYWYETVLIGDQCWFAENLRTLLYANGDSIPAELTDGEWISTTAGASAVYGEGSSECNNYSPAIDACDEAQSLEEYGRLYNWYAADDTRGLCPAGWHVPTDGEWTSLEDYITSQGFAGTEGAALKSTTGWNTGNGTNDFGFAAFPGGSRNYVNGDFGGSGNYGYWWSSSPDGGAAWRRAMSSSYSFIFRGSINPRDGFSVRCLLDTPLQGCTDSSYIEFNPSAELDDGSCLTLLASGCTDSFYVEFDPLANVDDGSCLTLVPTEFACGDSISYWGSTYATIMIGDQCWFKDNLKTTRYTDGSPIHPSINYGAWNTAGIDSIGAYSVYYAGLAQDSVSCSNGQFQSGITEICDSTWVAEHFGFLYNWHVINSPLSLCPPSWHVPSDEEWINYELLLGMSNSETDSVMTWSRGAADSVGFKMFGNTAPEWATYPFQVTDDSNSISCTPSGLMVKSGNSLGAGSTVTYWSSSGNATSPYPEINPFPNAWMRQLDKNQPGVWRTAASFGTGGYVRCLLDSE